MCPRGRESLSESLKSALFLEINKRTNNRPRKIPITDVIFRDGCGGLAKFVSFG